MIYLDCSSAEELLGTKLKRVFHSERTKTNTDSVNGTESKKLNKHTERRNVTESDGGAGNYRSKLVQDRGRVKRFALKQNSIEIVFFSFSYFLLFFFCAS